MIVEDISSVIDPSLSQIMLRRPFVKISNMTHDPPEGVVRFINGTDKVAYKTAHKIEQYNSLSDLEKEYTKSVYLRNDEDRRRGVEYVMSKIFLQKMPRVWTPMLSSDLTNEITCRKFLIKNEEEIFIDAGDGVRIYPDGVASPVM
uniref:Retrotransposon Orf1 n=1 Tax=Tanacetum cinerariifolium TaxID=118510 RepID=A0A6L2KP23_TANCI|nr:retrotransposon Orf1 [Tanacetum cinerariifolium]